MMRKQISAAFGRRRFLQTGAIAAAAACLPFERWRAHAQDRRTISTNLSWIPNSQFSGLWMGLENGYFDELGVNVDWRPGGPNTPSAVERVASGEINLGQQGNPRPVLEAITRGNDFVVFGATYQRNPGGLLSLAANPILTPEDIVGKRILMASPTDARTVEVTLAINGLPNEFSFVPGGVDPQPLLDGQADAMLAFATSQTVVLERQGMVLNQDFFHRTWADLGQPGYNNLLFSQRSWLTENRQLVVDYLKGEIRGWEAAEANPEEAARLSTEEYGVDFGLEYARELRSLQLILPFLHSADTEAHGLYWVDPGLMGGRIYEALRLGGLDNLPDVASFVDTSILEDVHAT